MLGEYQGRKKNGNRKKIGEKKEKDPELRHHQRNHRKKDTKSGVEQKLWKTKLVKIKLAGYVVHRT